MSRGLSYNFSLTRFCLYNIFLKFDYSCKLLLLLNAAFGYSHSYATFDYSPVLSLVTATLDVFKVP